MRRVPCTTWPCRRCDKAGRTSWRSRERWHADQRDMWISRVGRAAEVLFVLLVVGLLIWGLSR